jgi:polyhydroxyalkanoate synthesis repressor PhaR
MAMIDKSGSDKPPVTIKKYANRRLYNTATSSYVTLDHLCQMVKDGTEFLVFDAKTGEDITRSVLTQIIVEEESKGQNLLPISFLRQLISFYGDSLQSVVPNYLEFTMRTFARNQEQMRQYFQDTFGGFFPFGQFEEMGKQNMAMFERAMKLFNPKQEGDPGFPAQDRPQQAPTAPGAGGDERDRQLGELKAKIDAMQRQLDALTRTREQKE